MSAEINFNLAISTDWDYDRDFINLIEEEAHSRGMSTFIIRPRNLRETIRRIEKGALKFQFLFDRASDTSPEFHELQTLLALHKTPVIEPLERLRWASDKATMHLEFISAGLHTPYTIILPPHDSHQEIFLSLTDLASLGRPFIIKPANTTGGGIGVVNGAESLQDILQARQVFKKDKYLLQEKEEPREEGGLRFWFRGFYSFGRVQCCWWNDLTHIYKILEPEEVSAFSLQPLFTIVQKIADICRLQLFSTEIALTCNGDFKIIDYVNESCDFRMQYQTPDGVPDEIVRLIATDVVEYVQRRLAAQKQKL